MNDIAIVLILVGIALLIFLATRFKTKEEKEYEKHLKESLRDEFIVDPETGAKLTLEQAQSGHWVQHDNEYLKKQENPFTEAEKNAEKAVNYLRESREYRKHQFSETELDFLDATKLLSKYDDWSYSSAFEIGYCPGFIFHPAVMIQDRLPAYYENDYHESQIMFWLQLEFDCGHYYLREKSASEKLLDLFRKDDELKLEGYESFSIERSSNLIRIVQMLEKFEGEKGLEIEFFKKNLLIKNRRFINEEDLFRMERLVKSLC